MENRTEETPHSTEGKDAYLKMLKNKDLFNKKMATGGGFEIQPR